MSQGPLCPNLSQKVQKEVSQMANRNLSCVILLGGLSVNLNHLNIGKPMPKISAKEILQKLLQHAKQRRRETILKKRKQENHLEID